jgi:uncharacterized membrane protein YjjP (DUF1212 family)
LPQNKTTEFISVLLTALVVGGVGWLIATYTSGVWQIVAIVALGAAIVLAWTVLRKRFGRAQSIEQLDNLDDRGQNR